MHYNVQRQQQQHRSNYYNALQYIRKLRNFMHIIRMHSCHYTIRFRFRPDTPTDIRLHPVSAGFKKIEPGTFLMITITVSESPSQSFRTYIFAFANFKTLGMKYQGIKLKIIILLIIILFIMVKT